MAFGLWVASLCLGASARDTLWEIRLRGDTQGDYDRAVEVLFASWEKSSGIPIAPGKKHKAALKINTQFGPGLATPKPLIRGVIAALEKRGFARADILLVDMNRRNLLESGFLSPLPDAPLIWEGVAVLPYDTAGKPNATWFYDSPLPTLDHLVQSAQSLWQQTPMEATDKDRRSNLPTELFLDADFWINLPALCDSPGVGVDGVLASATVRSVTNNERFLLSKNSGPVAIAEIAAIPEWKSSLLFSIVSLENFQFIAGPIYNANYTGHEPVLWLSDNPVWMDYQLFLRFNERRQWGLQLPQMEEPLMFNYAKSLGVGDYKSPPMRVEKVY